MEERERLEEIERLKYRQQLDDRADQEKEKIADFYKDVENFQVKSILSHYWASRIKSSASLYTNY